jgi:hypothetical protein
MGCSSSKSTKKGNYNKVKNLKQPISYTIDRKGNLKAVYSTPTTKKNNI